jgi:hypothetical protein
MNNLALSVALATAPSSAFEDLRERPRFWFPLLVLVASTAAIMFWYYSTVDIEWLKEVMFGTNPDIQKLPEEQRAATMSMMTRTTMLWGSVIGSIVAMPIVFLVSAVYLLLAAKVTKLPQGFRFKHWYAFCCWTSLPLLLNVVVSAIFLIMSDNAQVSPSALQPMSLNELLLHRPMHSPGYTLFESLTIPSVLCWILMIIGVRVWSQRSWAFSTLFILLPSVVIYGIWAFLSFR